MADSVLREVVKGEEHSTCVSGGYKKWEGAGYPKKKRNDAPTMSVNGNSLKWRVNSPIVHGVAPFGDIRDTSVRFAITIMASIRNAVMRIDQPKPTWAMRRRIMMGKMTPPREDPDAVIPRANARRLKNQVETQATAG